jgi:Protein of unknown function (DUF3016)
MKTPRLLLAVAFISATSLSFGADGQTNPAALATVSYDSPEKFTDFKSQNLTTDQDTAYLCGAFTAHIERLAKQYLPPNTRLEVRFKDIDLAGDFEPQSGPRTRDIRVLRDIYPPRMKLEFRLLASDGAVLAKGERSLTEPYYTSTNFFLNDDQLRYDKQLLTDWIRSEFGKKKSKS